jgi:hypothetical protein
LLNCPDGYWNDVLSKKCQPCKSPCVNCLNDDTCKTCIKDYYFIKDYDINNCIKKCPDNYYPDNGNFQCIKCKDECRTCSTQDICHSCNSKYFYNDELKECNSSCKDGFIENNVTNNCDKCEPKCRSCKGSKNICTSCSRPFYLNHILKDCVEYCPTDTYKDNIYISCEKCHPTCVTCNGSREKDCLTCDEEIQKHKLIFGYCVEGCPSGYIREKDSRNCIDFKNCFNYIIFSNPKIFSITNIDYSASLVYKLNDDCSRFKEDIKIEWNLIPFSIIGFNEISIPYDKLKPGILYLKSSIKYEGSEITSIKRETLLVIYKVNEAK